MLKLTFYRHLDEINRVAIPKEIRNVLDLQYGDKLEISLNINNEIVIRKVRNNESRQENV